ncbi:MAG: tetratricopeptide (TPR) repeat protein [Vicingaceae bacterium]|jgi:tetratricopeptide (TPR) repeat protein
MKIFKILSLVILVSFLSSCGNTASKKEQVVVDTSTGRVDVTKLNMENLLAEIKTREEAYKTDKKINNRHGFLLMEAYGAFSERFNNRENADEYLFKAGEIAMGANLTVEAIRYLTTLYDEYPRYKNRAYGLFLLGFVQENQANNLDEAKRIYEQFLVEFPGHEMADDARASINNLGKSPEQIIREFERMDSIAKVEGKSV